MTIGYVNTRILLRVRLFYSYLKRLTSVVRKTRCISLRMVLIILYNYGSRGFLTLACRYLLQSYFVIKNNGK